MSKISSPVFLCYILVNFTINSVFLVSCTNNHFSIYILRSLMNIFDIIVVVFHFTLLVVIIIKAKLKQFNFLFSCLFVLFCRFLLFQILFKNCRWIFSFHKLDFPRSLYKPRWRLLHGFILSSVCVSSRRTIARLTFSSQIGVAL